MIPAGTRVRVHFNLHTHLWSVTSTTSPNRGRVIANVPHFALTNCRMIVSEPGRQRVLVKKQRAVHAWIEGFVADSQKPVDATEVTYNPYRAATFHTRSGEPVLTAAAVWFDGKKAYIERNNSK